MGTAAVVARYWSVTTAAFSANIAFAPVEGKSVASSQSKVPAPWLIVHADASGSNSPPLPKVFVENGLGAVNTENVQTRLVSGFNETAESVIVPDDSEQPVAEPATYVVVAGIVSVTTTPV